MIEKLSIDAIRILSADAVQKANSGHPGMPLGAAPIAYELWAHQMNHNPQNPNWKNRDRFLLSAGHASAMLYSLLHLFGYGNLSIEDIKQFRQLGSKTPGHPEYGDTVGVEATTGPLGAGLGMAVGMAMAEAHLASKFNREGYPVFDHYTYALCGDGCLMEGISSEVLSLAGTLGLGKLILLYDSNSITIEGSTELAFTEDVCKRMEAYGFQVISVEDGTDIAKIGEAIQQAKAEKNKPSLIKITTAIGYGVPAKEGKASAHGEPLGAENIEILRKNLDWPIKETFIVPQEVYDHYKKLGKSGECKEKEWNAMFEAYAKDYPELNSELIRYYCNRSIEKLNDNEDFWKKHYNSEATRSYSGKILNELTRWVPNFFGGSADLGPSNKSVIADAGDFSKNNYAGGNIHYGVRELGMTAIANGIELYGCLHAYTATFLVFADYMKPMIRLAALMGLPTIYILTHDSIGVGEDGPTHEPVEQLAMLRSIPNLNVFRPADEIETRMAWYSAVSSQKTPTAIVLTRQNLPILPGSTTDAKKGGYVVAKEGKEKIDAILIATGSEVGLAVEAKDLLEARGFSIRVVSMPCMELFDAQDCSYKESVLPSSVRKRIAIEAASKMSWGAYIGLDGAYITMDGFGASGPANQLFEKFGFTADNLVKTAIALLEN